MFERDVILPTRYSRVVAAAVVGAGLRRRRNIDANVVDAAQPFRRLQSIVDSCIDVIGVLRSATAGALETTVPITSTVSR